MKLTKKIKRIIAGSLAAVCLVTAGITAAVTNGFQNIGKVTENNRSEVPLSQNGDGMLVGASKENGIKLTATKLLSSEYEENGISAQADTAYTLTATVLPDNATDKRVGYFAAFVNPSSTWANGKNASDYVEVRQAESGSLTATLTCLQPFGEQIKITVRSFDNLEAQAECVLDYAERMLDIPSVSFSGIAQGSSEAYCSLSEENLVGNCYVLSCDLDLQATSVLLHPTFSVGTVSENSDFKLEFRFQVDSQWAEDLSSSGLTIGIAAVPVFTNNVCLYLGLYVGFNSTSFSHTQELIDQARINASARKTYTECLRLYPPARPILTFSVLATGRYSSCRKDFPIRIDRETIPMPVDSLSLNESSVTL